jgi:4-diphosphocytidyl-2-C-methyl-D-erythritol kinase
MMAALAQSDLPACNQLLRTEMEEGVLVEYQDIQRAREALRQSPARGVLMSGSGSAVFGLFGDKEAAEMTAHGLPDHGEVFVAPFVNTGCRQAP